MRPRSGIMLPLSSLLRGVRRDRTDSSLGKRSLLLASALWLLAPAARAEGSPEPPAMRKAAYSLPFALRPAIAPNLLRLDTAVAFQKAATTEAGTLTGGGKPISSLPDLGFYGRIALVHQAPDTGPSGTGLSNPLLFALYTPQVAPGVRVAFFVASTVPVGAGGGDSPDVGSRGAMSAGIYSRQAMDNALFATNYLTPVGGIGVGYIRDGITLQAEATVFELIRTRGSKLDTDSTRTNFTSGLHAGYLIGGLINVSAELHYQRWLSTPAPVSKNGDLRGQLTAGGGLRANIPLGDTTLLRPGVGFFVPLDAPMTDARYRILQIDVPVAF